MEIGDVVYCIYKGKAIKGRVIGYNKTQWSVPTTCSAIVQECNKQFIERTLGIRAVTYVIEGQDGVLLAANERELFTSIEELLARVMGDIK